MKKQESLKQIYGQEVKKATREQQEAIEARDRLLLSKDKEKREKQLKALREKEEEARKLEELQEARRQVEEKR